MTDLTRLYKIPIWEQQCWSLIIGQCHATQSSCKTSQVYHLSLEWHHNNVWLTGFYPPYCHCCTWPRGTTDGTCAHTCQVCPPALAWCLCAAGRLHSLMTWPASPCRWYSPGIANQNTSAAMAHLHNCGFHSWWGQWMMTITKLLCPPRAHAFLILTSSGSTLIFSVYLRTTSSGFFPCYKIKHQKKRDCCLK